MGVLVNVENCLEGTDLLLHGAEDAGTPLNTHLGFVFQAVDIGTLAHANEKPRARFKRYIASPKKSQE